jgi:hypothetical protein
MPHINLHLSLNNRILVKYPTNVAKMAMDKDLITQIKQDVPVNIFNKKTVVRLKDQLSPMLVDCVH